MMPARRQRIALLLTGAVVLGSAAYALGSQAGGGNADASGSARSATSAASAPPSPADREQHLSSLASRLGVDPAKLRAALDALRPKPPAGGDRHAELAAALAGALGIPQAKVTSALDALRAQHDRQGPREWRHGSRPGAGAASKPAFEGPLAKALGVTTTQLDAALTKVRAGAEKQSQARRDAFAQALAGKLGIPVQKVKDAVTAAGAHGPGDGHMGPGHDGGPGEPGSGAHWG